MQSKHLQNGSENPSTTLRTGLSQTEPIAIIGSYQNMPPGNITAHRSG